MNNGFIKLHRKILDWEWYTDANTFRVFIHCLFKANYEAKKWRGNDIERGQFITSVSNLANDLNLSARMIRTSLSNLQSTDELTIKTTNRFSLITVNNYHDYQVVPTNDLTNHLTNERQSDDKQTTTTKEVKELKELKKEEEDESILPFDEFWILYDKKIDKVKAERSYKKVTEEQRAIIKETLPYYVQSTPDKQIRKHPTTYINAQAWENEILPGFQSNGQSDLPKVESTGAMYDYSHLKRRTEE